VLVACQYQHGFQGVKMYNHVNLSWRLVKNNFGLVYKTVHLYQIQKTPVGKYRLLFKGSKLGVYSRLRSAKEAAVIHFNEL